MGNITVIRRKINMEQTEKPRQVSVSNELPGYCSLWKALRLINPEHLFAAIIIGLALTGMAFGVGYKYLVKRVIAARIQSGTEQTVIRPDISQFNALQAKERFFSLYVNYLSSKQRHSANDSIENRENVDRSRSELESLIREWTDQGETASDMIQIDTRYTDSSGIRHVALTFAYDNSVVLMEPEFNLSVSAP